MCQISCRLYYLQMMFILTPQIFLYLLPIFIVEKHCSNNWLDWSLHCIMNYNARLWRTVMHFKLIIECNMKKECMIFLKRVIIFIIIIMVLICRNKTSKMWSDENRKASCCFSWTCQENHASLARKSLSWYQKTSMSLFKDDLH